MKDQIVLKRIKRVKDLPMQYSGRKKIEERDYTVMYWKDGELKPAFLQLNDEAKRIYIDLYPSDPTIDKSEDECGDMTARFEKHDNLYTEYGDYDDDRYFFETYQLYVITSRKKR